MVNFILKGKPFPLTILLGVFLNFNLLLSVHGQKIQTLEFYFQQESTDRCDDGLEVDLISFKNAIPDVQAALGVAVDLTNIRQIRVVGAWVLYSEENFEGTTSIFPNDGCYAIDKSIPIIRSARFLGNQDARLPGISLFPSQPWPTGNMIYYGESNIEIDLGAPICVASWATTGSWTFFSGPAFTGLSKCRRGWGNNGFLQVYSIKQGCGFTLNSNNTQSLVDVKAPGESRFDVWVSCRPAVIVPITTTKATSTTPESTTPESTTPESTTTTPESTIPESTTTIPESTTPESTTTATSPEQTTDNEIVQTSIKTTGTTGSEGDEKSTTENSSTPQIQFSTIMSISFVVLPILINFY